MKSRGGIGLAKYRDICWQMLFSLKHSASQVSEHNTCLDMNHQEFVSPLYISGRVFFSGWYPESRLADGQRSDNAGIL